MSFLSVAVICVFSYITCCFIASIVGSTGKGALTKKHVLVMDEVDGMAGNEDRGKLISY